MGIIRAKQSIGGPIPDEITRDAEYIAADAAHVAALHPPYIFGFGQGISTEDVFDYGSGFLDCRQGGGTFPPGASHIQGFQSRFAYWGGKWGMQLVTQHSLNADCFFRTVSDGNWGPWRRIWNDGNFNPSNYLLISEGDNRYRQSAVALTDADIPAAIARDAETTAALNAHVAAVDPHPVYLTQVEGDGRYRQATVALTDADIPAAIARDVEVDDKIFAAINALVVEGSFSSSIDIVGMTTQGVATYISKTGFFTKIANTIFFELNLSWTAHTGTGFAKITGLPFGIRSWLNPITIWHSGYTLLANNVLMASTGVTGTTEILLSQVPVGGGGHSNVLLDTAAEIRMAGSYLCLV